MHSILTDTDLITPSIWATDLDNISERVSENIIQ